MNPCTGIATVCLSGTLPDKLAAAAHAGFDGVELFEPDLLGSPLSPMQIRGLCAELGLTIDLYQPFRDVEGAPEGRFEATQRRARRVFATMEELGCDLVLICSSVAEDTIDDDELAAAQLRQLAEIAADYGVRIAYEALAWGAAVNTWQHSWEIVRRADHPSLGLCLDSFHVLSRSDDLDGLAEVPAEKLFFLQLADAPHLNMDVLQWSRHHRLFPGQGAFDLVTFTGAVLAAGYKGPLSLEVFNDVFRQSPPALTAVDAHRSLRDLTARIAQDPSGDDTGENRLPAAPSPADCAFVEIEATPSSALGLRTVLRALGFVHRSDHRSKPVELWDQGSACLLINVTTCSDRSHPFTRVAALGLHTENPQAADARARALSLDPLPRVIGDDEAAMPAYAIPDGTGLFLCPSAEGMRSWTEDFAARDEIEKPQTNVGLTRIDHVSLTQPFDRFDESILLMRSFLGVANAQAVEHAGPFGLVRSQELTVSGETLGVVLNASVLRRGTWSPGVVSPQHIALHTDDAFAAAEALARSGAPVLDIPANHYADLQARLGLDDDFVAALSARSLLYERDVQGGECFHLFTQVVGSQVYFEIIERRGGYKGYPTADTTIRMAAHAAQRASLLRT
ncbi:sugar phosphate isomerase/epimerase and 4-hydroxyphenylpyruvate domain-containing protein [Nesterenkonia aerolata]|uniref:3-dehydroshikimate dehydratase n=1 Tax=Nesterenkonia aerolata TaxID=3074079 RepID=A0ABU2DUA0_9MICC|nr:TIM barrel protein [Nesterenkonia sp. LY-0111]MDR8019946.1 TIM barrel protein [Nesterenkonia sp. LY-0111]